MAINNNEESYRQIFESLFNPLFQLALSMLKCKEQAQEVASDVLFRVWQNRLSLLEVDNIKVYVLTMARNHSLNLLKKNARLKVISLEHIQLENDDHVARPDQIMIDHQNQALIQKAIQSLPTRCKLVFKLIKEEGLSYKEVAEILNISPKTVDAHLVTAMKKLSDALKVKS